MGVTDWLADSRVCSTVIFINNLSIIILIVIIVSIVRADEDDKPLEREQLLSAGQVRNLVDNTLGKIFNKPRPTKVFTSMTVLNKIPVKTYTTARPRKQLTTRKITTRRVTTKTPHNNVVTVPTTGEATVLEIIESDEQFSTLRVALEKAGFTSEELDNISPLTVFAPTNSAFAKISNDTLITLLEDKESLSTVLLRHVVPGRALRIPAGQTGVEAGSGDSITIQRSLDDIHSESIVVKSPAGSAKITELDITARDGVIFAIDTVI